MISQLAEFDFDRLAQLAKEAPAEFERLRAGLIQQAIGTFRNPAEGYQIQGKLDARRTDDVPGQEACLAIAEVLNGLVRRATILVEGFKADN